MSDDHGYCATLCGELATTQQPCSEAPDVIEWVCDVHAVKP